MNADDKKQAKHFERFTEMMNKLNVQKRYEYRKNGLDLVLPLDWDKDASSQAAWVEIPSKVRALERMWYDLTHDELIKRLLYLANYIVLTMIDVERRKSKRMAEKKETVKLFAKKKDRKK